MRRVGLLVGVLVLAGAWLGPLPELARRAFWAHMTMHRAVVAVAAPLLALGVAGGAFDPVRAKPMLSAPILASLVELVVVWTWHAPALHHAARRTTVGLLAEQGSFLLAGLLLWLAAFGGGRRRSGERSAAGVVGLLLTAIHMTLLGALLALSQRPLYRHAALGSSSGASGLTPLQDQHLGGAIMLLVGGASDLLGGLWLTAGVLRPALLEPETQA
ncbi:cytochrome c oxidase assembly protein [soil metagenome]